MGFGIREPKRKDGGHVPGTSILYEEDTPVEQAIPSGPKHADGGKSEVILVPQPSDSPNDPLVGLSCIMDFERV